MRVTVRVVPRARRRGVEQLPDGSLRVRVTEPAEQGRANAAVIKAPRQPSGRAVTIRRGAGSRSKLIEIAQP